ncbi:substrate-binding periplasmic protein [Zooshikella harenae]|uniref:Transporter substrate-binding domain-containing protein n=1 Tax=Zooshikella harenae TaxID=2827238 RepID=A0ABS5ZJA6_9GAMM|nr:transporter substrate-binding domain-containing protein [Zooshikella harenae]MBU2713968.1 transporter substrate-binding domain-containing protein [Zooshikella harenae]
MFTTSVRAEKIPLTILSDIDYYPYSFVEQDKVTGVYTKIIERVLQDMHRYQVTLQAVPWKRGLKMLAQGKAFAMYPPYKKRLSRPFIDPYSKQLMKEIVSVFCREDILLVKRPRWPQDYYGLTIGLNVGFIMGGEQFHKAVQEGIITIKEYPNNQSNLIQMLIAHETDCYMNDRQAILLTMQYLKKKRSIKQIDRLVEGTTVSVEYGHLGYTNQNLEKYPFKQHFVHQFDQILGELELSGELQTIISQYWKEGLVEQQ